jgi:hypothetical protein
MQLGFDHGPKHHLDHNDHWPKHHLDHNDRICDSDTNHQPYVALKVSRL